MDSQYIFRQALKKLERGSIEDGISELQEALQLAEQEKNILCQVLPLMTLAQVYNQTGQIQESSEIATKALSLLKENNITGWDYEIKLLTQLAKSN